MTFLFILLISSLHFYFSIKTNTFFSLDDFTLLANFRLADVLTPLNYLFTGDPWGFHKNLGYLIFYFLFKLFGTNPLPFQSTLFALHSLNLIVVYLISYRLSKQKFLSLLAPIILNTQYLHYFSNLHEYLTTLFSLCAILLYLHLPKKRLYTMALVLLAILSKEIGVLSLIPLTFLSILNKRFGDTAFFIAFFAFAFLAIWMPQIIGRQTPQYYQISLSPELLYRNFISYYPYWLGILVSATAVIGKRGMSLSLLGLSILTLLPSLLLVNRHEAYYLYLPYAYLAIGVATSFAAKFPGQVIYFLVIIYFLGGRGAFPPIARQNYPNWQKHSIETVVEQILPSVDIGTADLSNANIERDARLMLDSGTTDLFFPQEIKGNYQISFDSETKIATITKR